MATMKYSEAIKRSKLVRSGSPNVYQLQPRKENLGGLKRKTLGTRDVNIINKTILVVGETGGGKSTLINALVNYAMGVQWKDNIWFQMVKDKKEGPPGGRRSQEHREPNQTVSQTSDVIVYQIFGFEGQPLSFSLTIIDTPGFGDTRGIRHDDAVKERLLEWFRCDDGVHEINAVGLVLKASENRLSDRLMYIFDSVVSLFGKNMEKNIVALITHSDGLKAVNALEALTTAGIKCAKNRKGDPLHFLFNNHQSKEREDGEQFVLKFAWDFSNAQLDMFAQFLGRTSAEKLNATVDVLNERTRLQACMKALEDRVRVIKDKQREIQQERNFLTRHETKREENKNYTEEIDEVYQVKKDIEGGRWGFLWLNYKGAMNCLSCKETCHHEGCTHATDPNDSRCVVMKDGRCTVCRGRCETDHHVKTTWIYETRTRKITKTLQEVKDKFEKHKAAGEKNMNTLQVMERMMDELQRDKDKWLDEAYQHVLKLDAIALKSNVATTHHHLDFLIEGMKERADAEKVRKLEELKSRMDPMSREAMKYMRKMSKTEGSGGEEVQTGRTP